ncbi:Nitrogen regulation protein NtrX [hydrothermal vent metagenome]|uniref:Nitrogen regulation protein NtrX n=1 Tax=hydrothermal vent metagenome TaxID=652676 RepID=A0A3B0ZJD2_9ZZZZ
MKQPYILVVDDEPDIRQLIQEILQDEGYQVAVAKDGEEARTLIRKELPELILLDVWMPDIDGITLYKQLLAEGCQAPVIIMSGHGTVETAVEATRLGAYTFLEKPLSMGRLLPAIEQALSASQSTNSHTQQSQHIRQSTIQLVGKSAVMQRLREQLSHAAKFSLSVIIEGESGTGKTFSARYLHDHGLHRDGPFVACHLAALPVQTMINTLFGKEQDGQITPGKFELASGGTLYIANIEQLTLAHQDRLTGYLKSGEYFRQGGDTPLKTECRLIFASSCDLPTLIEKGHFRSDLYQLLKGISLHTPPLSKHSEDIPELLNNFVDHFVEKEKLPYRHFGLPLQNCLRNYHWPGNIKELNNIVRQLLITGTQPEVRLDELNGLLSAKRATKPQPLYDALFSLPLREARESFERCYLIHQMEQQKGVIGNVAKAAGVERTHLYRKLRALGIEFKSVK